MNGNGSMADGTGKPATASACASCRHQRKRCGDDCVFAPYFPASSAKDFLAVQKVFGVSNVSKMLQGVEENHRQFVAESLLWEATRRQQDPVRGPYGEFQRVQNELRYYQSMAAAWQKPPLQSHQPYKPALPGTALVKGRYANTKNHNKSKEANGIISSNGSGSNTSVTNFAGGEISTFSASIPTYALDSGSSAIDLSPYGSMSMHTDGQRQEIVLNHQNMEAAPVHAIPLQPHQHINCFNHQHPYHGF